MSLMTNLRICAQVTTPVLKLFAELVQNRSQRLQFDVSSPNGILLFREASKIICTYGSRILNVNVSKEQVSNSFYNSGSNGYSDTGNWIQ